MTLVDHKSIVERLGREYIHRKNLAPAYGSFIANLCPWDWFLNPITIRDPLICPDCSVASSDLRFLATHVETEHRLIFDRSSLRSSLFGNPPRDLVLRRITEWLSELEENAGRRIGWMLAEEFGRTGGRWHCHGLVTGVAHLRRDDAWRELFSRFGRARIEPFDPFKGGAFYAAKYAAKQLGYIHFGGVLGGIDLRTEKDTAPNAVPAQRIQCPPIIDPFFQSSTPYRQTLARLHR